MYLIYIDESGKCNDPNAEYFVLSSIIINEHDWQKLDNEITKIKINYFSDINPDDIELHSTDIHHGNKTFKNISESDRLNIFLDIAKAIHNNNVSLISIIIDKNKIKYITNFEALEEWAYRFLYERIVYYVNTKNDEAKSKTEKTEYALLLIDTLGNDRADYYCRKRLRKYLKKGSEYNYSKNIVEDILFVKSHWQNLSQLADFVAFITRRKIRNDNVSSTGLINSKISHIYTIIEDKFITKDKLQIGFGIKKWP